MQNIQNTCSLQLLPILLENKKKLVNAGITIGEKFKLVDEIKEINLPFNGNATKIIASIQQQFLKPEHTKTDIKNIVDCCTDLLAEADEKDIDINHPYIQELRYIIAAVVQTRGFLGATPQSILQPLLFTKTDSENGYLSFADIKDMMQAVKSWGKNSLADAILSTCANRWLDRNNLSVAHLGLKNAEEVIAYCKRLKMQLKYLNLADVKLSPKELEEICTSCPKIVKFISSTMTDERLVHLNKLKNLTDLNLGDSDSITDEGLDKLKDLKKLQYLSLLNCDQISMLPKIFTELKGLDLSCTKINDKALENIGNICGKSIIKLNLYGCDITIVPGSFTSLNELDLSETDITDTTLEQLGEKYGKSLLKLMISGCENVTIIPETFIVLNQLSLNYTQLTNENLEQIGKICGKSIKKLEIKGCKNITIIPETFITLEELAVNKTNITHENLEQLGKVCGTLLKKLQLYQCEKISTIPKNLTALKELDLSNTNISDESLEQIGEICGTSLLKLDLSSCNISTIPESFTALKELNLNYTQITNETLVKLGEVYGKSLEELQIIGCTNITVIPETLSSTQIIR